PPMHREGAVPYVDALFTSTSALCVTGLTTVNTARDFTVAGQTVILVLIQLGGLGIMAYAALALSLVSLRVSLRTRAALESSLFQQETGRLFIARLRQVFVFALGTEALGALLLSLILLPKHSLPSAAWSAVFHSVSAFCNAGFSIYPENLEAVRGNHLFLLVVSLLIVSGGLGFIVLAELRDKIGAPFARLVSKLDKSASKSSSPALQPSPLRSRLSLHTRVVLVSSLILIVAGAGLLLLFGAAPGEQSLGEEIGTAGRISAAFFQSVSARTCGFNTVPIGALPLASLIVLVVLMFIGGSPGSCAGGIKTTSAVVLCARLRSLVTGRKDTVLGGW
ncbi:MAG: potassium transporter TrkG, partial [Anaerolineae bacterium]